MLITKTVKVPDEVADHIRGLAWADDGRSAALTGDLDRAAYVAVNKVLEAAGGKWSRKHKAHLFPEGAREALDAAVGNGGLTVAVDGYFPTPPAVIDEMMTFTYGRYWAAFDGEGMFILEPSAGEGALALALRERWSLATLDCIERDGRRCETLAALGFRVQQADFMEVEPRAIYDVIIMNPPFERQQDVDHIMHAARFLKPTGYLVSVASSGVAFRDNAKTTALRALVEERGGSIEPLPEGSFTGSGTGVNTVLVYIPGADAI